MKKLYELYGAVLVLVAASCASVPEVAEYRGTNPIYPGAGEGASFLIALNQAKMNAVKTAVIDIIGSTEEMQHHDRLTPILYADTAPQGFVENEYVSITKREETYRGVYCEIRIPVKMNTVMSVLLAEGISLTHKTGSPSGSGGQNGGAITAAQQQRTASLSGGKNTEFLESYMNGMLYMVVPSDHAKSENVFSRSAVAMANKYLLDNGLRAVDYAAVEKLKEDSAALFKQEPETADLTLVQWIAQKLGADVYIEIDGFVQGGTENGGYFGKAEINLKMYNPSTGELLGSVPYASPKTFDRSSADSAAQNALKSTVFKAMASAVDQSKKALERDYRQGIRYELVINNTADSKLMSRFRAKLKNEVETIRVMNQSAAQTKYAVQYFGTVEDMEDIIYAAAEAVPGLTGMELIMIRGKTLVFRSGL